MLGIRYIDFPSPASSAGLRKTDRLASCNNHPLDDWLDFVFHSRSTRIELTYARGPLRRKVTLRRTPGTDWGFVFEGQEPRRCRRKCIFCFVEQLPPDVRNSLRIKDDDIRYSFLHGMYVTLSREDVEYAVKRRLSPIHVSVHATDPALRGELLGTNREEPVIEFLEILSDSCIEIETQIVLVPGYNDGEYLDETLAELFPIEGVTSVGVVPVGLTRHRKGLAEIRRPGKAESILAIQLCEKWRSIAMDAGKGGWVYPSDELFILAGLEIPPIDYYGNRSLRENGIGMLAELQAVNCDNLAGEGLVCTGTMAHPFIADTLAGTGYRVVPVENSFLGEQVGVAGLIAGADLLKTLQEHESSMETLYLPSIMFNGNMLTIDDFTPADIAAGTGMRVVILDELEELD